MEKVEITRQAVCAADDQIGPLDLVLEVKSGESIRSLIERILANGFLQFSSSHNVISGFAGENEIARVFSSSEVEYLISCDSPWVEHLPSKSMSFRFPRSSERIDPGFWFCHRTWRCAV